MAMPTITGTAANLPVWLQGDDARLFVEAVEELYNDMGPWLAEVARLGDISQCPDAALALHAADRQVDRYPGEPLASWRNRVLNAVVISRSGGELAGLKTILAAFGLQNFSVVERPAGFNWDVIQVVLDPTQLSLPSEILDRVLHRWGRLCRRYAAGYRLVASSGALAGITTRTHYYGAAS